MQRFLMILGIIGILGIVLLIWPRPQMKHENLISLDGIVIKVYEGGTKDLCVELSNSKYIFYINRGIENGLNLNQFKEDLIANSITLSYLKPGLINFNIRTIGEIRIGDKIYYSAIKRGFK